MDIKNTTALDIIERRETCKFCHMIEDGAGVQQDNFEDGFRSDEAVMNICLTDEVPTITVSGKDEIPSFFYSRFEIEYCPKCGRWLGDKKENEREIE